MIDRPINQQTGMMLQREFPNNSINLQQFVQMNNEKKNTNEKIKEHINYTNLLTNARTHTQHTRARARDTIGKLTTNVFIQKIDSYQQHTRTIVGKPFAPSS